MKTWKILFWFAVLAGFLLIPTVVGVVIAAEAGAVSCTVNNPTFLWMCIRNTYILLPFTGVGVWVVVVIIGIIKHIRDIAKP